MHYADRKTLEIVIERISCRNAASSNGNAFHARCTAQSRDWHRGSEH